MSDEELRKLAEWIDQSTVDWNGERMSDLAEPRITLTCGEYRAAASAILSLLHRSTIAEARLGRALEALREIDGLLTNMQPKLVTDGEWIDFASFRLVQASAAILSLMSERDEANARALNWECRFEAASARGAAAEARIRELSLSELTALGQAHENHKRALDAEARLERALEALRDVTAELDEALHHLHWLCRGGEFSNAIQNDLPINMSAGKEYRAAVEWMGERESMGRFVRRGKLMDARSVLSDLEVKDDNG